MVEIEIVFKLLYIRNIRIIDVMFFIMFNIIFSYYDETVVVAL